MRLLSDLRAYVIEQLRPSLGATPEQQVTTVPLVDSQAGSPQQTVIILRAMGGPSLDGDLDPRRVQAEVVAERSETARLMLDLVIAALLRFSAGSVRQNMLPQDGSYEFAGGTKKPWCFADFLISVPANTGT